MDAAIALAKENIRILSQAEELIEDMSDTLYTHNDIPPFPGTHTPHPDFGVAASTLVHWQTVGRPDALVS